MTSQVRRRKNRFSMSLKFKSSVLKESSLLPLKRRHQSHCKKNESGFDKLPDEMVEKILDFAKEQVVQGGNTKECQSIRLVCRRWNKIFTPKVLRTGELKESTIDLFAQLNPGIKLKRLVLSGLKSNRIRKCRRRRTGEIQSLPWTKLNRVGGRDYDPRLFERTVEHLIVGGEAGFFLRNQGTTTTFELPYSMSTGFAEDHEKLQKCWSSVDGTDLAKVISQFKDVKTLTFSSVALMSMSTWHLRKLHLSQYFGTLSTLDLCIGKRTDPTKLALLLEKCTFPNLSALYIRVYTLCCHCSVFINFYRFISKHPLLKELSLSQAQAIYSLPKKANCENSNLQLSAYPGLFENLMKINLKCLRMDCLIVGHPVAQQWKDLELAFIKNQTKLQGLELQINLRTLNCRLDEVLPPCKQTLQRLELTSCNTTPNHFDCSTLSNFTRVQDLNLYMRNFFGAQDSEGIHAVRIVNLHRLPTSIEHAHIGRIPSFQELGILKERLKILKRVSYNCCDTLPEFCMYSTLFVQVLVAHLRFPSLVEFRMNQFACSTVVTYLHRQSGLVAYIEDTDSIVVLVDRDNLNLQEITNEPVAECKCPHCIYEG